MLHAGEQPDSAVTAPNQRSDTVADGPEVVCGDGVDGGVPQRAVYKDDREAGREEFVDHPVVIEGRGDDQAVHDPGTEHAKAVELTPGVLAGVRNEKPELMRLEDLLHLFDQSGEVAVRDVGYDEPNGVARTGLELSGEDVGRVLEFVDCGLHSLPGRIGDEARSVDHVRDGRT